jgi:hypothetical protein
MLQLLFILMMVLLLGMYLFLFRQDIRGQEIKILGVRSIFPRGNFIKILDPKNNWQGYGFAEKFRFFSRSTKDSREDFQKLVMENFSRSPLKQDLVLFDGGIYVLQKAGKGYRLFCLFFKGSTNYWADMLSRDSLHFSRLAFERFILNLDIDGARPSPAVAVQIRSLQKKISPLFMQTPAQLLGMMAMIFALVMFIAVAVNLFSGSRPRRLDFFPEMCTAGVTLIVREFGRRRLNACCLCREGESLVIYRFRRPFLKIDIRNERQNIVWEKNSLNYKKIRVILAEDDFQNWRSRFL